MVLSSSRTSIHRGCWDPKALLAFLIFSTAISSSTSTAISPSTPTVTWSATAPWSSMDMSAGGSKGAASSRGGADGGGREGGDDGRISGDMTDAHAQLISISLFGPEEKELDRYSAALAGTHFLRQERDKVIKDSTNPLAHLYLSMSKPGQHNRWMSSPWISDKARQAQKKYLVQAGNIIRSNGLTTARYNELSHILGKKRDLRERVQQQAYLYRVNADLRGDKIQPLVDISDATIPRRRGSQVGGDRKQRYSKGVDKTMLFAKSLREVEAFRLRQRRRLMKELGCDELPPGVCRPSVGRMPSRLRKACDRFPLAAENIVMANGLKAAEFNRLSAKSKGNLLYRWKVLRCIKKLNRNR